MERYTPAEPEPYKSGRKNDPGEIFSRQEQGIDTEKFVKTQIDVARKLWQKEPDFYSTFKKQGFDQHILNAKGPDQLEVAIAIARRQPHFLPDDLKSAEENDKGYFMVALARVATETTIN